MCQSPLCWVASIALWSIWAAGAGAVPPACESTSIGATPLSELGTDLYLGQFEGGLYPSGRNVPPRLHRREGRDRAIGLEPLDTEGQPSPDGKMVFLSIGMSNVTQEFCSQNSFEPCDAWTFMGQAAVHPGVNHSTLAIVNGAFSAQSAPTWASPTAANYDRVLIDQLTPRGLSERQVQVVWMKQANPRPTTSLPDPAADAFMLESLLGDIARAVKVRYPNCTIMLLSSRIYAGYASTNLNPEPYAYESAFAVKWLIEAQINQRLDGAIDPVAGNLSYATHAPWLAWGPYLWADGLTPRSDGLIWKCRDFQNDGTHPATSGELKVAGELLRFMLRSPFAKPWFRAPRP